MYSISSFTFVFIIILKLVSSQKSEGDLCTVEPSGSPGTCKLFSQCAQARKDLRQFNRFPQICGFKGALSVICCVERVPGEISKKKCREYEKYVYVTKKSPILSISSPEVRRKECGHQVVKLIVGGEVAGRMEFPHMASIGYEPSPGDVQWLCGGTIISKNYILTAAHCLSSVSWGDAKFVRIGVTNLNSTRHRQQLKIAELIPHPQYNLSSFYHDIGLLKLEKPAKMNPFARPACLYLNPKIPTEMAIATGWGLTRYNGQGSAELRKVILNLYDHNSCNSAYKSYSSKKLGRGIVDDIQVCANWDNPTDDSEEDRDTCQGDSGGPLQIYHTGDNVTCMYDVIGVTSFGKSTCSGRAGVYVRVSNYVKWIEDVVWP